MGVSTRGSVRLRTPWRHVRELPVCRVAADGSLAAGLARALHKGIIPSQPRLERRFSDMR